MAINYLDFAVEQTRRVHARIQAHKDQRGCPSCGGELSGDVARDGREDETCGSPHCREQWYGEVAERR